MITINEKNIEIKHSEISNYNIDTKEKLSKDPLICVLTFEDGRLDDIIFGIKFVKNLIDTYPTAKVLLVTGPRHPEVEDYEQNSNFITNSVLKDYSNRIMLYASDYNKVIELDMIPDIFFFCPLVYMETDVKFIVPKNILKEFTQKITEHTHALTEYEYKPQSLTFEHKNGIIPQYTGILLDQVDEDYEIPDVGTEDFALCYFYSDKETLKSATISDDSFGHKLGWADTWAIATLDLLLTLEEYLYNVEQYAIYTQKDITVLIPDGTIKNLEKFFRLTHEYTKDMYYIMDRLKDVSAEYHSLTQREMYSLFQKSIPLVFLTGDQAVQDFVAVNEKFEHNMYYQMVGEPKSFKNFVPEKIFGACTQINTDTLYQMKHSYNYAERDAKIIHGLMLKAINGEIKLEKTSKIKKIKTNDEKVSVKSTDGKDIAIIVLSVIIGIILIVSILYLIYLWSYKKL